METRAHGRILYFNHDNDSPSGGVRAIYQHVAILNRNGFSAFVVHRTPGFKPSWFSEAVPTLYFSQGLVLQPTDILVIPEDLDVLGDLKNAQVRKVIFCQNHFYAIIALPPGETWRSLGVTHVLASSEIIADFVQKHLGWPEVPVVHCSVDHQLFRPGPKKLQIAYMPRKRAAIASFVSRYFETAVNPPLDMLWLKLDELPIDRVAASLAESAIFLSLSYLEGLGLPPLEAMASGCVVVGYHGYGGLEYATQENGFWCEEQDPIACIEKLKEVLPMIHRGDDKIKQVVEAGFRTAAKYTPQRQEQELIQFMNRVMQGG